MEQSFEDRRKYKRYGNKVSIAFSVEEKAPANIQFRLVERKGASVSSQRFPAITRDVSAAGVGFTAKQKLQKGDILHLELTVEGKNPAHMVGEVKWCQPSVYGDPKAFDVGIELSSVNSKSVSGSVRFDEARQVIWSDVLEAFFGKGRMPI